MRLAVLGATGRTGIHVVAQALKRGHSVVAIARGCNELEMRDARLERRAVDVLDRSALDSAVAGTDGIISTLGIGSSRQRTLIYSQGVANILAAMSSHGIERLVVTSAAPAGPRDEQPFVERRVLMPVLERFFGATYRDMRVMEATLQRSSVTWVALRPPRLLDKAGTGHYRVALKPLPRARSLTFADLATAHPDTVEHPYSSRRALYVAN
jgi:putative NADH-flavin reductase